MRSVDIKDLKLYQQIFVYITPIVTNLGCINVMVVVVRLRWFRQKFKGLGRLIYLSRHVVRSNVMNSSEEAEEYQGWH